MLNSKASLVSEIFSTVSSKYDIMNDIMSLGLHRKWKDQFTNSITNLESPIIDMACGTGDITSRIYKKLSAYGLEIDITAADINQDMLNQGKQNLINKGIISNINYQLANAMHTSFNDDSFNCYTIAFGIRNVDDIDAALKEAYRILKPGGQFLCLEFSHPNNLFLAEAYNLYSDLVIPFLGEKVTGSRKSYQYLVNSIKDFPSQGEFLKKINSAGFKNTSYENLSAGIVAIHTGYK
jgi:demethylmenaquinone methyltransferase/2-methoxy-6-polyprenyl-1,4-benzoquinol methylase